MPTPGPTAAQEGDAEIDRFVITKWERSSQFGTKTYFLQYQIHIHRKTLSRDWIPIVNGYSIVFWQRRGGRNCFAFISSSVTILNKENPISKELNPGYSRPL